MDEQAALIAGFEDEGAELLVPRPYMWDEQYVPGEAALERPRAVAANPGEIRKLKGRLK